MELTAGALYELVPRLAREFPALPLDRPPWALAARVELAIAALEASGALQRFSVSDGNVFVHPDAAVDARAVLRGPVVISAGCTVAPTAFLRDGVVLGPGTHVGHAVELKSCIVAGGSALAHLGYVGNSVIGSEVNLEAGVVVANHLNESPGTTIVVRRRGSALDTGERKFGALIGDRCSIGANSVLSPGTILEPGTVVPRLTLVSESPP